MSFAYPSLLALGLPLVALPLLIHLINLRKHRRIEWAAMEFLLESQKRNKKWILLRQFLLLLLRTSAVALMVLMLASPSLQSQWGRFLGKGTTHHWILLDDSYSMADRREQTSVFDEAKRAMTLLLEEAAHRADNQQLTLLKFSQAAELTAGAELPLSEELLNLSNLEKLQSQIDALQVAESNAGPRETIRATLGLPEPTHDETRIVYLVSDFRQPQWTKDADLRQLLDQLRQKVSQLHLIQCVEQTRPNLAITQLKPESGIRATGVETSFELTIANYGDRTANAVIASIQQDGHKLPAVSFDQIEAGKTATRRFRTTFSTAGPHRLKAELQEDALPTDNVRYFACDIPREYPVLLIDGSEAGDDGYYLRTALRPSGTSQPGWNPQVEPPSFLRKQNDLSKFAAICLLDVARLEETEVTTIEKYVAGGGGLGIFLGPSVNATFYNEELYRSGAALLPAPLDVPTQLLAEADDSIADISVSDHPIFHVFSGQRNSFLSVAKVQFYYALDPTWRLPSSGETRVLARIRNGAPLVLEKKFGEGRVVVQLCKLSPKRTRLGSWSNWSLNPVFPVFAHELIGHLSSTRRQTELLEVGVDLQIALPETDYQPEFQVLAPGSERPIEITSRASEGMVHVDIGGAHTSGVWEIELTPRDGNREQRLFAVNVPTGEGDLHYLNRSQLADQLEGIDYEYALASQMSSGNTSIAGYQLADTLLYLLLAALVVEQWLAYQSSYHRPVVSKA